MLYSIILPQHQQPSSNIRHTVGLHLMLPMD